MLALKLLLVWQAYAIAADSYQAPLHNAEHPQVLPGRYIVKLERNHTISDHWQATGIDLSNHDGFRSWDIVSTYRVDMDLATLDLVRSDPKVRFVEANRIVNITTPGERINTTKPIKPEMPVNRTHQKRDWDTTTHYGVPYYRYLASAGEPPGEPAPDFLYEYQFESKAGKGVDIYIMDTGVRITHQEFGGRATIFNPGGGTGPSDHSQWCPGETNEDIGNHGTAVAAVAAGNTNGIAPFANIRSVKMLCYFSDLSYDVVIDSVAKITQEHVHKRGSDPTFRGSVVNMSWRLIDCCHEATAAAAVIEEGAYYGVHFYAAAGNDNIDALVVFPCYIAAVICIGATDNTYTRWSDSNYGKMVNYAAPGVGIHSAGRLDDDDYAFYDGTSFATPYAAGTAAIFASWKNLIGGGSLSYLWWNSFAVSTGWAANNNEQDKRRFVMTGMNNPYKFAREPFRWAGNDPVRQDSRDLEFVEPVYTADPPVPATTDHQAGELRDGSGATHAERPKYKTDVPHLNGDTVMTRKSAAAPTAVPDPLISSYLSRQSLTDLYKASNTVAGPSNALATNDPNPSGQVLAWASYTNPLGDPNAWTNLIGYNSDKLGILVANVLNGPDYVVDKAWADVISRAAASGKKVLGYVRTGYLGISQQQFKTRLGSSDLVAWTSQIEQDVDKWFELYKDLGGIFFDEGWPECGPNNIYADLYTYINNYTKKKHPGAFTVLNPGSPMAQCFENSMDTLLTFEASYETYRDHYVPNDWTPKNDRKIWHIVYGTPQEKINEVAALSQQRHAGYLEITNALPPNPYAVVPFDPYMQAVLASVSGGLLYTAPPSSSNANMLSGVPGDSNIVSSDYTSVTISWGSVDGAKGYGIYRNGAKVLEMPPTLNKAVIGMLEPGQSGLQFEVRTLLDSTSQGDARILNANTNSLPDGGPIQNVQVTHLDDGNAIYKADVLVPYAFVRLFIASQYGGEPTDPYPGWPIVLGPTYPAKYGLANYLVEGNDYFVGFFKYTGHWKEDSGTFADWSWQPLTSGTLTQSGYTYTWNVPTQNTPALVRIFVVQGQGYAPVCNVTGGTYRMNPCPNSKYCWHTG